MGLISSPQTLEGGLKMYSGTKKCGTNLVSLRPEPFVASQSVPGQLALVVVLPRALRTLVQRNGSFHSNEKN